MDAKTTELYLYDYNQSDVLMVEEKSLVKQLQEEAELCSNNEHTEDEVTAAIGMIMLHYQASETHFTPKNKPIHHTASEEKSTEQSNSTNSNLHGVQKTHVDMKHQIRKNRKSNSSKSSLLASCRNILKEFLSQNSM